MNIGLSISRVQEMAKAGVLIPTDVHPTAVRLTLDFRISFSKFLTHDKERLLTSFAESYSKSRSDRVRSSSMLWKSTIMICAGTEHHHSSLITAHSRHSRFQEAHTLRNNIRR